MIVSPIASPAIALKVPRGSTAVAKTDKTRKKVRMTSMTKPCRRRRRRAGARRVTDGLGPRCTEDERGRDRAGELEHPVDDGKPGVMRRVTTKPSVIAGLKWPPEMWPRFVTMIPMARPLRECDARGRPTRTGRTCHDAGATADQDQRERADELAHHAESSSPMGATREPGSDEGRRRVEPPCARGPRGRSARGRMPALPQGVRGGAIEGGRRRALPRLQVPPLQAVCPARARGAEELAGSPPPG